MSLSKLGKKVSYKYNDPLASMIEVFPSPSSKSYNITHETEEFTSLCPITGQPDFGKIVISYTPIKWCIESKSLKLYLGAYRMFQGFMENMANKILDDLVLVCNPQYMNVEGIWKSRGGIKTNVSAFYESKVPWYNR